MEADDPRLEYLSEIILKTFKLKPDKWNKLLGNDEHKQVVVDFFEKTDNYQLIFQLTNVGALLPDYEFPTGGSKFKSVYFIKKEKKDAITKDKYRGSLLFGDLSYSPLDQLSALVDELLVPLLSNQKNHHNWPVVVSQDVLRHVHQLKNNVFVISGQVKGRTLLPLPVGTEKISNDEEKIHDSSYERTLVHSIESAVIDWSHQISKALKSSSAQPLFEGSNPTPLVELDFWKARAINLENIFDQLNHIKVCFHNNFISISIITRVPKLVVYIMRVLQCSEKQCWKPEYVKPYSVFSNAKMMVKPIILDKFQYF